MIDHDAGMRLSYNMVYTMGNRGYPFNECGDRAVQFDSTEHDAHQDQGI